MQGIRSVFDFLSLSPLSYAPKPRVHSFPYLWKWEKPPSSHHDGNHHLEWGMTGVIVSPRLRFKVRFASQRTWDPNLPSASGESAASGYIVYGWKQKGRIRLPSSMSTNEGCSVGVIVEHRSWNVPVTSHVIAWYLHIADTSDRDYCRF